MNWKLTTALGAGLLAFFAVRNRRQGASRMSKASADRHVTTASDDSFPASDPPSYTPTGGARAY
jgi:hypothetical protein